MNNSLKAMAAGLILLPISINTFAQDAALTGSFKTIKDVTITQVAGHEMVINGLQMASGSQCIVATPAVAGPWPGDVTMLASTTGPALASATYGDTTGVGCSPGKSVPGIYEIDGAAGAQVLITLANASAGGLTYIPSGCVVDYNNAADGDTCFGVTVGTTNPGDVVLASTADQTVSAGNGQPVAGKSRLVLGGQVTSSIGLSAATAYVVPFDITVTY